MCDNKPGGCGGCGGHDVGLMAEAIRQALLPTGTLAVRSGLIPAAGQNPLTFDWHVPFAAVAVNVISGSTAAVAGAPTVVEADFAAGASAAASLPAGYSMTGFTITSAAPAAEVSGTVVVNGLTGANQNYTFNQTVAAGGLLQENFPQALGPFTSGSTPTVTVPAISGGAAGHIVVFGTSPGSAAASAQGLTIVAGPPGPSAPGVGPGVVQIPANKGGVFNLRGNSLTVYGGTPGDVVIVQAFTKPQPVSWG
jgi:hypothetical protein